MPFVDSSAAAANCIEPGGVVRAAAKRLWHAHIEPSAVALASARDAAQRLDGAPGRVASGGAFQDGPLAALLRGALPGELGSALRPRFEWYYCRGAFFHNDAHFGAVLFGVWCLAGPARDMVFPRLQRRIAVSVGDAVVFDPFEPHAVLDPGAVRYRRSDYEGAPPNVFLGFELELTATVRSAFGIGAPVGAATVLSSSVAVDAENGALSRSAV